MPTGTTLLTFAAAALLILLVPGPGVLYVVARSLSQGRRAGLLSVLGLSVGALVHVMAAVVGLSALLVASATAFDVVRMLGALYLVFLGVRTLRARDAADDAAPPTARSSRRLFGDGVIVSVLNPKIAIFFLAFLPQFADPSRGPVARQVLLLGLLYVAMALVTDGTYALLAGTLRARLGGRFARSRTTRRATGALYIGLGVGTALTGRRH
jgi:threonine/homoserine/homoserine lactone efflux protein